MRVRAPEPAALLEAPALPGDGVGLDRSPPSPDRLAVVVGIDAYPASPLAGAVADARMVGRTLRRMGFPAERTRVLIDADATRQGLLDAAAWLADESGPHTTGVFFFAGHARRSSGDPDGDGEDLDEAIVTADGSLLYDGELAEALEPARGKLWLAFASCFGAGFDDALAPGRIGTFASAEDDLAYEATGLGHSFLVEYVVRRGMLRAGLTSVEESFEFASEVLGDRRFASVQDDRLRGRLVLPGRS